ncbi:hypothetical protein [Pectobacterium aroidearum]|uniref:hypothetical protein n=1 Tax=Pectobacterium aroidearum TaxID=1201031 RepID=UPI00331639BA
MPKKTNTTPEDVFIKIEALAAVAQFLTDNAEELALGLEIMGVIENIANQAQKEITHAA